MENMKSILLTYNNPDRISYQRYAEFFRLAGIYVCEECRTGAEDKGSRWDKKIFSVAYVIGHECEAERRCTPVDELREKVEQRSSALYECYDDIEKIYNECRLLQASVTIQYFRTKVLNETKAVMKEAGDAFEKAADEFVELVRTKPWYMDNQYVRYAKLYCKQKANLARYFCNEPVVYYVNDLGAEGMALLQRFPEFSNAWVLLGFVYEISQDYVKEAIDAFQRAIQLEGQKPYVSSIYYWLGKRCEEYSYLKDQAYEFYRRAYQLMPKFRNIYKVANWHMQKKDWENAILYYQNCLIFLNARGSYQDPLEQEYCFKVNIHICYCYMQQKEYANAIPYAEAALQLRQKLESEERSGDSTRFYYDMYGEEKAGEYIKIELNRMQETQAHTYLAKAYQEINKPGLSKEHLDKALSEKKEHISE